MFNPLTHSPVHFFQRKKGLKGVREEPGRRRGPRPQQRHHPRTSGPATPATAHAWPRQGRPREPGSLWAGFRAPPPPLALPGSRRATPRRGSPARGGRPASRLPRSELSAHTLTILAALSEKREGPPRRAHVSAEALPPTSSVPTDWPAGNVRAFTHAQWVMTWRFRLRAGCSFSDTCCELGVVVSPFVFVWVWDFGD